MSIRLSWCGMSRAIAVMLTAPTLLAAFLFFMALHCRFRHALRSPARLVRKSSLSSSVLATLADLAFWTPSTNVAVAPVANDCNAGRASMANRSGANLVWRILISWKLQRPTITVQTPAIHRRNAAVLLPVSSSTPKPRNIRSARH